MTVETPGSYQDFLEKKGTTASPEAVRGYSDELQALRIARAAELGVTLEDLHMQRIETDAS